MTRSIEDHERVSRKKLEAAALLWWAAGRSQDGYLFEQASIATARGAWQLGVEHSIADAKRLGLPTPKTPGDLPASYEAEALRDAVDYETRARALGPAGDALRLEYVLERITSSQTYSSFNDARREAIRNTEGSESVYRTWMLGSERPCSICTGLNGTRVRLNDSYPGGYEPGSVHYNCRCTESYDTGMLAKDAVTMDLGMDDVHIDGAVQESKPMTTLMPGRRAKRAKKAAKPQPGRRRRGLKMSITQKDGSRVDVRHMSDKEMEGDFILEGCDFDSSVEMKMGQPVEVQIAKQGRFFKDGMFFDLDDKVFDDIIRNFNNTANQHVPVDFEHASELKGSEGSVPMLGAPAQGWIRSLEKRGQQLWGQVQWGDLAAEYIKNGNYRYLSPAVRFGCKDTKSGKPIGAKLTSAGLVNIPFLDGMTPLTAKDGDSDAATQVRNCWARVDDTDTELDDFVRGVRIYSPDEYMPKIRVCLKLGELSTALECKEQLERLREHYESVRGDIKATPQGIPLNSYLVQLRDVVGTTDAGMTWEGVFQMVDEMIDEAIEEHEYRYHGVSYEEDDDDIVPVTAGPARAAIQNLKDSTEAVASPVITNNEATASKDDPMTAELTVQLKDAQTNAAELSVRLKDADTAKAKLELQLQELSTTLATTKTSLEKISAELVTMKDEKSKRDVADQEREVDVVIMAYGKEKGLSAANKPALLQLLKGSPEGFHAMYPPVDPSKVYLMSEMTSQNGNVASDKEASLNGTKSGEVLESIPSQDELVKKFMKDGDNAEVATSKAFTEVTKARMAIAAKTATK